MPRTATTEAKEIERNARNRRIVERHRDGLSEREIARELGCSRTTVWTVLQSRKTAEALR